MKACHPDTSSGALALQGCRADHNEALASSSLRIGATLRMRPRVGERLVRIMAARGWRECPPRVLLCRRLLLPLVSSVGRRTWFAACGCTCTLHTSLETPRLSWSLEEWADYREEWRSGVRCSLCTTWHHLHWWLQITVPITAVYSS